MDALTLSLRAYALTTPDRARALGTGLAAKHENALIHAINAISQACQNYCRRPLHQVSYSEDDPELFQGHGREVVQLSAYPVLEIESVAVGGTEISDFSSAKQFLVEGRLYREAGWPFDVPRHADLTGDPDISRPRYNVAVAYTGGYMTPWQEENGVEEGEPLPEEIEQAVFRELSDLLNGGRNSGRIIREKTAGGYEVQYAMSGVVRLSRETQDVLSSYQLQVLP